MFSDKCLVIKRKRQVKSYTDLEVWQRSHEVALAFYRASLCRKKKVESFEIWSQGLRSTFSVPANIVEGYYSHKGKKFVSSLEIARGSAGESHYWIRVLREIGEISEDLANRLSGEYEEIIPMLSSIINKLK